MSDPILIKLKAQLVDQSSAEAFSIVEALTQDASDGEGTIDLSFLADSDNIIEAWTCEDLEVSLGDALALEEALFEGAEELIEESEGTATYRTITIKFLTRGVGGVSSFEGFLEPIVEQKHGLACAVYVACEETLEVFSENYFGGEIVDTEWHIDDDFTKYFQAWFAED